MVENKYLIKFCDRQTGQLLIPFGHIDKLVMPSVSCEYQELHNLGSKAPWYLPGKTTISPFSAVYEDLENNQGGYFFYRYFSLELQPTKLCGSIFASKEMKMLVYFDEAYIISSEMKRERNGEYSLAFSLRVNGWEYVDINSLI